MPRFRSSPSLAGALSSLGNATVIGCWAAVTVAIGIALLISGVVITESVFNIPGIGRLVVDAISRRDYPIIQGAMIIFAGVYVLINLAIDISYGFLDPRIRYN